MLPLLRTSFSIPLRGCLLEKAPAQQLVLPRILPAVETHLRFPSTARRLLENQAIYFIANLPTDNFLNRLSKLTEVQPCIAMTTHGRADSPSSQIAA